MKPANLGFLDPAKQERQDAFYDPSSADGYSGIGQSAFAAAPGAAAAANSPGNVSAGTGSGPNSASFDQSRNFREAELAPSPFSSPLVTASSPGSASHHHSASFGSGAVSPPSFALQQASSYDAGAMQSIGQLGQISLDDNQRYAPVFDQDAAESASNGPFYSHKESPALSSSQTPFSGSSMAPSHSAFSPLGPSTSTTSPLASAPQLTLGIPTVSISDTAMHLQSAKTVTAASSADGMPSIEVMAPSPSTPKAGGRQDSGGFQHLLAQLQANQQSGSSSLLEPSGAETLTTMTWSQEPESYSTPSYSDAGGHGATGMLNSGGSAGQPWLTQNGSASDLGQSSSPQPGMGGGGESQLTYAELSGGPQKPTYAQGHWSNQAKRQDSYDKIRQFLRLDVDMGFVGGPKFDSPTSSGFRKRATSDVGPRSPIAGLGSDPEWLRILDQVGSTAVFEDEGKAQAGTAFIGGTMQAAPGHSQSGQQTATMDPSLLNGNIEGAAQNFAGMPASSAGLSLPYQNPTFAISAPADAETLTQQQRQQHDASFGAMFGGGSGNDGAASQQQMASWKFPFSGNQPYQQQEQPQQQQTNPFASFGAPVSGYRRSHSGRSSPAGHRRAAQSEDLSRFGGMGMLPQEDFLTRITAPDGGLAPPSAGRSVSGGSNLPSTTLYASNASSRAHPYRMGHERHQSWSSNASNSSAASATGSASPAPHATSFSHMPGPYDMAYDDGNQYSAIALPTYGSLSGGPAAASVGSSVGSPGSNSYMSAPPVPVVTSQATQAASASRRKGEALFSCPIPGCGSTFTRQYNLRGHLRSHADERPFKCEWPGCGKSFARAHDCKRHQNLHLNIKPHVCEQCGKTFARLDALNRHHKTDNGGCLSRSSDGSDTDEASTALSDQQQSQSGIDASVGGASQSGSRGFGGHVL